MEQLTEKQLEQLVIKKLKEINPSATRESLAKFLETPSYRIRSLQISRDDYAMFGSLLSKISEAEFDKLLTEINDDRAIVLIEYLHRYMQYIGAQTTQMSGNALKFEDKVISAFGKGILLRAGNLKESLVSRSNNSYKLATTY